MTYYILAYVAYCLVNYRACRWFQIKKREKYKCTRTYGDIFSDLIWSFFPVLNVALLVLHVADYSKDKKPPTWL